MNPLKPEAQPSLADLTPQEEYEGFQLDMLRVQTVELEVGELHNDIGRGKA